MWASKSLISSLTSREGGGGGRLEHVMNALNKMCLYVCVAVWVCVPVHGCACGCLGVCGSRCLAARVGVSGVGVWV